MALYALAITGRFGLGHGMLAWGRSVVWAKENDAKLIAPNWLQLRIGPYLRRERDKRFYFKLFQAGAQVAGLRKVMVLARATRVKIEDLKLPLIADEKSDLVVEFHNANADNELKFFHEIHGHSELIKNALWDMTKPRYRPSLITAQHIAVHIRGGDFGTGSVEQLRSGKHNMRLPLSWYVEIIVGLRKIIGKDLPVILYSDCSDAEIASVLALPAVIRSTYRESVSDMLAMSQATVMVSSGSGFSRWGSYLGQVPRICYPGQRGMRVIGPSRDAEFLEPELTDLGALPNQFLRALSVRMDQRKFNSEVDLINVA